MSDNVTDLVGWPYADHGRFPGPVDCYGLVIEACHRLGMMVPDVERDHARSMSRFIQEYYKYTYPVDHGRLGDIVVFPNHTKNVIHMGVMLDEVRFIHAYSKAKEVVISRINRYPWSIQSNEIYRLKVAA